MNNLVLKDLRGLWNAAPFGIILLIFHECPLRLAPFNLKYQHASTWQIIHFLYIHICAPGEGWLGGGGMQAENRTTLQGSECDAGRPSCTTSSWQQLENLRGRVCLPTWIMIAQAAQRDSKGSCCSRKMSALRKKTTYQR